MPKEVVRIGVLEDAPGGGTYSLLMNALGLAVEAFNAERGRRVELVHRPVEATTWGSHDNVAASLAAWRTLVHEDAVLGIIGPSTTPAVLAAHPIVEAEGVPQIHWAGTDLACGAWHFQYQAGYFPDEGPALAYLLARSGRRRVAAFRGESAYGSAYLEPFLRAARHAGLEVTAEIAVPPTGGDLGALAAAARDSGAEAVVAMGLFRLGVPLAQAISALDWDVACYGNLGFAMAAQGSDAARAALRGWICTDMFDARNTVMRALIERYHDRYGVRPASAMVGFADDLARLMLEAVRLAPTLDRAGLREGLMSVHDLPAAAGGAGTRMGFGSHDRLALKGPRVFLFSQVTREGVQPYLA
jgi:ABC-type branched-subunit amino acid transport system substrate-binding protein